MVELTRTVRVCVNDPAEDAGRGASLSSGVDNAFAAWPAMRGLGRYYEVTVAYEGEPDGATGYLVDIRLVDRVVRERVLPVLGRAVSVGKPVAMGRLMGEVLTEVKAGVGAGVSGVALLLTPMLRLRMLASDPERVLVTHSYEFSSAHRLALADRDDAENFDLFGKCANPAGHGHNYRLDVTVGCEVDEAGGVPMAETLDGWVDRRVIEVLDHKHLNEDVAAFAGLNPSVEHIAQVIWGLLAGSEGEVGSGVVLDEVRVWETGKTSCRYRGPVAGSLS
ncbi:MAG: 6-carboxytetrahydropterin synthase [Phycisphaeraceae bacterium]